MDLYESRITKIQEAVAAFDADTNIPDSKKALVSYISSNLFRIGTMQGEGANKALLMLIAALGILSSSDDQTAISSAKRLVSIAFSVNRSKGKNK